MNGLQYPNGQPYDARRPPPAGSSGAHPSYPMYPGPPPQGIPTPAPTASSGMSPQFASAPPPPPSSHPGQYQAARPYHAPSLPPPESYYPASAQGPPHRMAHHPMENAAPGAPQGAPPGAPVYDYSTYYPTQHHYLAHAQAAGHSPDVEPPANLNALSDGPPGTKPPYPYSTIIRYAIQGSPRQRLTLSELYECMENRFPWYKTAGNGWKVCPSLIVYATVDIS